MTDIKKPTRLDLRHLRYALAVADASGFRAAAETLNNRAARNFESRERH